MKFMPDSQMTIKTLKYLFILSNLVFSHFVSVQQIRFL
jgi:hypothetical protein